jgi:hypothetical protein
MVQKVKRAKKNTEGVISLAPLPFEAAIRAALATGKAPPLPKKAKPKGKKT